MSVHVEDWGKLLTEGWHSPARCWRNGCLWVLCSGARRCDLPERYGKWKAVHRRFSRWCRAGVRERVFEALTAERDNRYLMIDSTIVRAHQQSATGKGGRGSSAGAFRVGLTTPPHHPLRWRRSPPRRHDPATLNVDPAWFAMDGKTGGPVIRTETAVPPAGSVVRPGSSRFAAKNRRRRSVCRTGYRRAASLP